MSTHQQYTENTNTPQLHYSDHFCVITTRNTKKNQENQDSQ